MPIGPTWVEPNVWDADEVMTEALADSNLTDNPNHLKTRADQAKVNDDGTSHTVGECVIIDAAKANHVERTTTPDHAGPVFVALGTVAAGATGYYRLQGVATVKVDGTVTAIGDSLATSATGGTATKSTTNPFGVALEAPAAGFVVAWVHNRGTAGTLTAHDHDTAGTGGLLTNDRHDGYSVYDEIAAPSAPAANTLRLYAKDKSTVTELFYKNSAGAERDLSGVADHDHTGDAGDGGSLSTYALDATLDAHEAATTAHGATGAVVGTTNTQTLSNKTLSAPIITDFTNAAHDHGDTDDGGPLVAAALPTVSMFLASSTATTSCTGAAFTQMTGFSESRDSLGEFASNTYTPTVAGQYLVGGCFQFDNSGVDGNRMVLTLYVNGVEARRIFLGVESSATQFVGGSGWGLLDLAANDAVTLYIFTASTRALAGVAASQWFAGFRVR